MVSKKYFRMLTTPKMNMGAELNAVCLDAFDDCFQKFLKDLKCAVFKGDYSEGK